MPTADKHRTALADLLELLIKRVCLDEVRVCMPATVKKYIPAAVGQYGPLPAMVEVEIDIKYARQGFEGDAEEDETFNERKGSLTGEGELVGNYPTFVCPVHFPGPAAMWSRGVPAVGEQGLVLWTDRDLGRWLVAGRDGDTTVDAGYSWAHGANMSSSVWQPGLASGPLWPVDVPEEGGKIGPQDGVSGLTMDSAGVTLDAEAAIAVDAGAEVTIDAGSTVDVTAVGNVTLDGALVNLGAAAAQVIALLPELKAPVATLAGVYAGLAGAVYATDAPIIKAGWAAFATAFAALPGSAKGRG